MEQAKTKVHIKWVLAEESDIGRFLSLLDEQKKAHPDMDIEAELVDCHG